LLQRGIDSGRLSFSCDPSVITQAEILWVAYDTPVDEEDQADVDFVLHRVTSVFPYLRSGTLVLISSQVPAGTTRALEATYRNANPEGAVSFAYSPENLRLGKGIETFTRPDRVVVGVRSLADRERIATFLKPITDRIEWMSVESAEMTKHALNAFLATSVTFANEIAVLCESIGADAGEVERGLKSDARIGPKAYLRPGGAFAGGTLGRDLSFLIERGLKAKMTLPLLSGVQLSNDSHKWWPRRRLLEVFGSLAARSIAVLGLTYKPGTDTLRRSSAVELCRWLHEQGAMACVYDPVVKMIPGELQEYITLRSSVKTAILGASAVLIATEWPEFREIKAADIVQWMKEPLILDPGRFVEAQLSQDPRIRYLTVGRSL
jgi:UDPglucose 6-dehydrogenase